MARAEYDVAIVGGGPVGYTLAILLAQRSRRVVLLERFTEPYALPRAVHYDHEIARILAAAGIDEVQQQQLSEFGPQYTWQNGVGELLLEFRRAKRDRSAWPTSNMFSQPELERLLRARADELPAIDQRWGHDVTGIAQDDAVVQIDAMADGVPASFTAAYVVGCDGANSFVRSAMGLPERDLGYFFDWLIVDLLLKEPRTFSPSSLQMCDPARPISFVPGGPRRRRFEVMRLPGETDQQLKDFASWDFLARWGFSPENTEIERHAIYTFQAKWAERWRTGRVLIAGDAAHQMPPFAGQGMCSGIRDAANLVWKLDLVLSGAAGDGLLDTYEQERSRHVQHAIRQSVALGEVICELDHEAAGERDRRMVALGGDPAVALPRIPPPVFDDGYLHRSGNTVQAGAGELGIHGTVRIAGRDDRWDQVFGVGFALIWRDRPGDLQASTACRFIHQLGGTVAFLGDGSDSAAALDGSSDATVPFEIVDLEGRYAAELDRLGAIAMLLRPDGYLFGYAADEREIADLLDNALAQLRSSAAAS